MRSLFGFMEEVERKSGCLEDETLKKETEETNLKKDVKEPEGEVEQCRVCRECRGARSRWRGRQEEVIVAAWSRLLKVDEFDVAEEEVRVKRRLRRAAEGSWGHGVEQGVRGEEVVVDMNITWV